MYGIPETLNVFEKDLPKKTIKRPWLRFWARTLDLLVFETLLNIFLPFEALNRIETLFSQMLLLFISILIIEPVQIYFFGTTLGKWLFGIKLIKKSGAKISYRDALKRSMLVWAKGYAGNLPFLSYLSMMMTYQTILDTGTISWDEKYDFKMIHSKTKVLPLAVLILLILVINMSNYLLKN